jgi:hypothetical protein
MLFLALVGFALAGVLLAAGWRRLRRGQTVGCALIGMALGLIAMSLIIATRAL